MKNQAIVSAKEVKEFIVKNRLTPLKLSKRLGITEDRAKNYLNQALKQIEFDEQLNNSNNSYMNHEGKEKKKAVDMMVNAILKFPLPKGTIVSLPSFTCRIEKLIMAKLKSLDKFRFIGYEYVLETFFELCKTISTEKLNISAIFGSIGEAIMKGVENEFAHLILDYCGVLDTFAVEIEHVIKNNLLQVNGTMSVTLSKIGIQNDKGIIGEIFKSMPKELFGDSLKQTELGVKLFFNKIINKNYEIEKFHNYQDKGKMAMMLIIVRRVA